MNTRLHGDSCGGADGDGYGGDGAASTPIRMLEACGIPLQSGCMHALLVLPCCCHAVAMPLPCHCHAVAMLLPCYCHPVAMSLPITRLSRLSRMSNTLSTISKLPYLWFPKWNSSLIADKFALTLHRFKCDKLLILLFLLKIFYFFYLFLICSTYYFWLLIFFHRIPHGCRKEFSTLEFWFDQVSNATFMSWHSLVLPP